MKERYSQRLRAFSRILYDRDPFVMGSSVSAPDDEYDSIAVKLVSLLRDVETFEECVCVLEGQGIRDSAIAEAIWEVIGRGVH